MEQDSDQLGGIAATVSAAMGTDITSVEPVPGSVANQDFMIDLADRRRVFVKIGPRAELVAEAWALERVGALGVPVPRMLLFADDLEIASPLLILEPLPADGELGNEVLSSVGRALAVVHTIQVPGYGAVCEDSDAPGTGTMAGPWSSWQGWIDTILADLDVLVDLGLLPRQQASVILRRAEHVEPSPLLGGSGVLLHGDLKAQHLLVHDGRLTGIIDWGDAMAGDPAWDLARASMMDPVQYAALADGYRTAHDPRVRSLLPLYRVLWNTRALAYEQRAGGDWFAEYQRRISVDLDHL